MLVTHSHVNNLIEFYRRNYQQKPVEISEKLYDLRIGSREQVSTEAWLNNLLTHRIRELNHHTHPMYIDLLTNSLSKTNLDTSFALTFKLS